MENEKKTNEAGQSMLSYVGKATTGYTKKKGQIVCNRGEQADQVIKLLKKSYKSVSSEDGKGGKVIIKFSKNESISESIDLKTVVGKYPVYAANNIMARNRTGIHLKMFDTEDEAKDFVKKHNHEIESKTGEKFMLSYRGQLSTEGEADRYLSTHTPDDDMLFDEGKEDKKHNLKEGKGRIEGFYPCIPSATDPQKRDKVGPECDSLDDAIVHAIIGGYSHIMIEIDNGFLDLNPEIEILSLEDAKKRAGVKVSDICYFDNTKQLDTYINEVHPDEWYIHANNSSYGKPIAFKWEQDFGEGMTEDCSSQDLIGKYPVVASDGTRSVFVKAFDKLPDAVKYCEDNEWAYERADGKRWILDIKGRIDSASGSETFLKRNPCDEALIEEEEEVEIKEFVRDPAFKDIPNDYVFWDVDNDIDFPEDGTEQKALYDKVLDVLKPEEIDYDELTVWVNRDDDYEEISWTYKVSDGDGMEAVDSYFENRTKLTMGDLRSISYGELMSDFKDQFYDRAVADAEANYDPDDYVDWDNMPGGHDWLADRHLDMGEAVEKIPYYYIELKDGPGGIDSTGRLVEFPVDFLEIDDPGEASALADYYSRKYGRKCVVRKGTYHVDGDKLIGKTDADYVDEAIDSDPYGQDNGFFTRDDLNEFTDACLADLGDGYEVSYSYITDGLLEVAFEKDDYEMRADERIDMRKIKKPSDLLKYKDSVVQKVRADYEENIKAAQ